MVKRLGLISFQPRLLIHCSGSMKSHGGQKQVLPNQNRNDTKRTGDRSGIPDIFSPPRGLRKRITCSILASNPC